MNESSNSSAFMIMRSVWHHVGCQMYATLLCERTLGIDSLAS